MWTLPKDQDLPPHLLMVGDKDPWVTVKSQKEYYRENIVKKHRYDGENIHSVKLTNKIFMSMLNLHPFFVVGQPKTLEYLRNAGFKTFGNFWNEGYDNQFNSEFRMNEIKHELRNILSKSTETIHKEFYGQEWDGDRNKIYNTKMFKILKHNYLFLPKHIENERKRVIEEINKFMGS